MGENVRRAFWAARTLGLVAVIALSGCYESEDETISAEDEVQSQAPEAAASGFWLDATDDEQPLAFVARATDTPAERLAPGLERASALYRESPRMIANRAVQLWQEIREKDGDQIDMVTLLDDLTTTSGAAEHSLGSVIQRYRVLRTQGQDHATAISGAAANAQ